MTTHYLGVHVQRVTEARRHLLPVVEDLYRAFALEEGHTNPVEMFTDGVAARLGDTKMYLALAIEGHRSIGYCLAYDVDEHPFIPTWGWAGYITQLFVVHERRSRGVGQALFDTVLAWFAQRGTPAVYLNVDVENSAGQTFWRKQGFAPCLTRMRLVLRTE